MLASVNAGSFSVGIGIEGDVKLTVVDEMLDENKLLQQVEFAL
jgi:hypothetical protein